MRTVQTAKSHKRKTIGKRKDAKRVERVQNLRFSNAAGGHRMATDYQRRPKHGDWNSYDD